MTLERGVEPVVGFDVERAQRAHCVLVEASIRADQTANLVHGRLVFLVGLEEPRAESRVEEERLAQYRLLQIERRLSDLMRQVDVHVGDHLVEIGCEFVEMWLKFLLKDVFNNLQQQKNKQMLELKSSYKEILLIVLFSHLCATTIFVVSLQ